MNGRAWTGRAAKAAAVLLVLALLYVVLRNIGFRSILAQVRGLRPVSLAAAAVLYLATFLLGCLRWQQLMKRQDRKRLAALLPLYMANIFGNVVTPGARVGGEPIRAYYMSKKYGGEASAYFGTILADKLGNGAVFTGFLVLSVIFVVFFVPMALIPKLIVAAALLVVPVVLVAGFLLHRHAGARFPLLRKALPAIYHNAPLDSLRRRFRTAEHFEEYVIRKLDNVITPVADAAGSPRTIAKVVAISSAAWLLFCLANYILFAELGADVGFLKVLVIVTISTFFGDVSVTPGGAGFIEAAMLGLCSAFGVQPDTAAAVTLIGRGLYYLCGLGVGGVCLGGLIVVYGRRI